MYNQDNREKVEKDERAHEAEERVRQQKHEQAESEYRRQLLLARARGTQLPARPQVRSVSVIVGKSSTLSGGSTISINIV